MLFVDKYLRDKTNDRSLDNTFKRKTITTKYVGFTS